MRARALLTVTALVGAGIVPVLALAGPAAAAVPAAGGYVAGTPTRVLDTRNHLGVSTTTPVGGGKSVTFPVVGKGSPAVPAGASAVVLNVIATSAVTHGYVVAYSGSTRPGVANLSFEKGVTVANQVTVPLSANGTVTLYNGSTGSVAFLADLYGYFTGGTVSGTQQGAFVPTTPHRVLSQTSIGAHPWVVRVTGAGVPASASAVLVDFTVATPATSGYLAGYPTGGSYAGTSNVNFVAGHTAMSAALMPIGNDGEITLINGAPGAVPVSVDVQGYFTAGDPYQAGGLGALSPQRISGTAVGAQHTVAVSLAGRGGVPLSGVSAVLLTVTVARPTTAGYLTVYGGGARPGVASQYFGAGQAVPNLVVAPVTSSGTVNIFDGQTSGSATVIVDVYGYVTGTTVTAPTPMAAHYLDNVGASPTTSTLSAEGCADAQRGATFTLLDVGAQSYREPTLSPTSPGVAVALTNPTVRLTYPQLVTAVQGYANGFAGCASGRSARIAVGTNNSGNFTDTSDPTNPIYPATARGADWYNDVIAPLQAAAPTGISYSGAIDLENGDPNTDGFDNNETRAQQLETSYLDAAPPSAVLIDNGSANGCPTSYGGTSSCADGWTLAQFSALASTQGRVQVLPQVYYSGMEVQWANIDRAGGGHLDFIGSLTEYADVPTSFPPLQGWAALQHSISTVVTTPSIPLAVDISSPTAAGVDLVRVHGAAYPGS